MDWPVLHAVDDPRFSVGGQAHGLRSMEFGVLERRQTHQPRDQFRRKAGFGNVDAVGQNQVQGLRQRPGHGTVRGPSGWRCRPRRQRKPIVLRNGTHTQHPPPFLRFADERLGDGQRHPCEPGQEGPLVPMGIQLGVHEHAVASATGATLQRQGDQVPKAATGQRVLAGEEPIVGPEPKIRALVHGVGEQHSAQTPCNACGDCRFEEYPNVAAITRSRTLQRRRNVPLGTGIDIGRSIVGPRLAVEIHRQKVAGLVEQHRIDAHDERLAAVVHTGQVPANHVIVHRQKAAAGAFSAFDPGLFANPRHPLVGAGGCVS